MNVQPEFFGPNTVTGEHQTFFVASPDNPYQLQEVNVTPPISPAEPGIPQGSASTRVAPDAGPVNLVPPDTPVLGGIQGGANAIAGGASSLGNGLSAVNAFFNHMLGEIAPHDPCAPPQGEDWYFRVGDFIACPANWWRLLLFSVSGALIVGGLYVYLRPTTGGGGAPSNAGGGGTPLIVPGEV